MCQETENGEKPLWTRRCNRNFLSMEPLNLIWEGDMFFLRKPEDVLTGFANLSRALDKVNYMDLKPCPCMRFSTAALILLN